MIDLGLICARHRTTLIEVASKARQSNISRARHELWYYLRVINSKSFHHINTILKTSYDRKSIIYGILQHQEMLRLYGPQTAFPLLASFYTGVEKGGESASSVLEE